MRRRRERKIDSLVSELARDEEESRLENAESRSDGNGVEVLDLERENLLVLVLDCDLEEISILGLQQEEEVALGNEGKREKSERSVSSLLFLFFVNSKLTFILCITAETMMIPLESLARGCLLLGIGTRC